MGEHRRYCNCATTSTSVVPSASATWRSSTTSSRRSPDSYLLTNDCDMSSRSAICTWVSPALPAQATQQRAQLLVLGRVDGLRHPSTAPCEVELDYGDCAIERVSVLDLIASSRSTRVETTPESVPGKSVRMSFDGWVFPRSGVGFVWITDSNTSAAHPRSVHR